MRHKGFHSFRLFPIRQSRLFVRAFVFDRRADMVEFWRQQECRVGRSPRAMCSELRIVDRRGRTKPVVACVSFWRRQIGTAYVTHEFFHATMAVARRVGIPTKPLGENGAGVLARNSAEERLADIHAQLCYQFVDRAHAAKLYDE